MRSISLALGRPVDVGSVTLRLLPQPGFELENFVVHEDPEFGAEPVLQSSDVVATGASQFPACGAAWRSPASALPNPASTWCAIAKAAGTWKNWSSGPPALRLRPPPRPEAKCAPASPTLKPTTAGSISSLDQEKKPYTLTEANFALWQDSENAWGMRLKAQPMRTDFNLSDTGLAGG